MRIHFHAVQCSDVRYVVCECVCVFVYLCAFTVICSCIWDAPYLNNIIIKDLNAHEYYRENIIMCYLYIVLEEYFNKFNLPSILYQNINFRSICGSKLHTPSRPTHAHTDAHSN